MHDLNFEILSKDVVSSWFRQLGIFTFIDAAHYVCDLPYKRNVNKQELTCVFKDGCGTCSTKHALLKTLALVNNRADIQLVVGIFRMNEFNTPKVKSCLDRYQLPYIPEAHCYLKLDQTIYDFTGTSFLEVKFIPDLLCEFEIAAHQIFEYKVDRHKEFLKEWLTMNSEINWSLEEIWKIREECISELV